MVISPVEWTADVPKLEVQLVNDPAT